MFFPKVSAQLPSNKAKSRPLTVAHSHVSSFLHVYSSSVNKLLDQFLMQMRDQAKTATPDLTSGWKSIPGDLKLRPSVNADLKFSAYNEGETVDDKRVANIVYR